MKVISPALSIYRIQISSIFSIFERISGVFLTLLFVFVLYLYKMKVVLLNSYMFYCIIFLVYKSDFSNIIFLSIFIFLLLNLAYHISFGIRYIIWDSYGMEDLNLRSLKSSVTIYMVISGIIIMLLLLFLI